MQKTGCFRTNNQIIIIYISTTTTANYNETRVSVNARVSTMCCCDCGPGGCIVMAVIITRTRMDNNNVLLSQLS